MLQHAWSKSARDVRTTWPRYDQHQQTRPGQHQQHQRRPVFLFFLWTSKKPLTQKDRILAKKQAPLATGFCPIRAHPPHPHPPLITPSSLCEVMNEAPSRGAFVTKTMKLCSMQPIGLTIASSVNKTASGTPHRAHLQLLYPKPKHLNPKAAGLPSSIV